MLHISLHRNADRRIRNGHPWVFSNEIASVDGSPEPGASCEIRSASGKLLGCGYYNPHSLIAVRLLAMRPTDIDTVDFFHERISAALAFRKALYSDLDAIRVVYGESDQLPGLVVDRYGEVISIQLLTRGMDRRRELILAAIQEIFCPAAVIARNDAGARDLEGLPHSVELLSGQLPEQLIVQENGLSFMIDVIGGQKTGGFLDQKENHRALRGRVAGQRILDLSCYSGNWSVHAASY